MYLWRIGYFLKHVSIAGVKLIGTLIVAIICIVPLFFFPDIWFLIFDLLCPIGILLFFAVCLTLGLYSNGKDLWIKSKEEYKKMMQSKARRENRLL